MTSILLINVSDMKKAITLWKKDSDIYIMIMYVTFLCLFCNLLTLIAIIIEEFSQAFMKTGTPTNSTSVPYITIVVWNIYSYSQTPRL